VPTLANTSGATGFSQEKKTSRSGKIVKCILIFKNGILGFGFLPELFATPVLSPDIGKTKDTREHKPLITKRI
jgi:hypothetical protein